MPNVEQILYYLNLDASNMKKGTMAMLDQQKKAAAEFVSLWRKASTEVDVMEATRNNRARALLRQRAQEHRKASEERTSLWKKELAAQRMASGAGLNAEARNTAGVAVSNLKRNVVGGAEAVVAQGLGHMAGGSTVSREIVTIMREASRGNWSRIPGSFSIILQSLGKLGTVITALVNPITGAIAGLAAGLGMVYKIGYNAQQLLRQSHEAGFSVSGYQTFLRQAGRESGGKEGAKSAMGTLSQNLGELREGDMGQMRKFRKYGIDASGSNEEVFNQILAKYEGTADPAKRAALAMDMFGEGYKKIIRTLDEGASGMNAAMGKGVMSAGQLGVLANLGQQLGDVSFGAMAAIKQAGGDVLNSVKKGYVKYATTVNPGLAALERESQRSEDIDAQKKALIASGKIKPMHMSQAVFERLHPELAAGLAESTMRQQDLTNELADRGKLGMSELSEMGRRLSGHIRPRQYTVTARMRTAMKIDDLEASATRAWERGDDAGMRKMRAEADAMRKANPWLKAGDRDPTRKVEEQLIIANKALKDVQDMAKFVMNEK